MNGKRIKALKKLIKNGDPNLFFTIRKIYGDETQEMNEEAIFKAVKKHWNIYGIKDRWGKPLRKKEII